MKFAKKYSETLRSPDIKDEWRRHAIEYRRLKKVINDIEKELADYGLRGDVLRNLLRNGEEDAPHGITAVYEVGGSREKPEPRLRIRVEAGTDVRQVLGLGRRSQNEWSEEEDDEYVDFVEGLERKLLEKLYTGTTSDSVGEWSSENGEEEESEGGEEEREGGPLGGGRRGQSAETLRSVDRTQMLDSGRIDGRYSAESARTLKGRERGKGEVEEEEREEREPQGSDTPRPGVVKRPRSRNTRPSLIKSSDKNTLYDDSEDDMDVLERKTNGLRLDATGPQEVVIPLSQDSRFMALLARAVGSLAELQNTQRDLFVDKVQDLALRVAKLTGGGSKSKNDLYVWREVFSLWVESQIFESQRERDRGQEFSVEEVDTRLNAFIDRIRHSKLPKRMRSSESRRCLEEFIKLNVELLALRRFSEANQEAFRKILKKHDKRTALPAGSEFSSFLVNFSQNVVRQEDLSAIQSGATVVRLNPVLQAELKRRGAILPELSPTTTSSTQPPPASLESTSLTPPNFTSNLLTIANHGQLRHSLLSILTSTLLPIVPQLENYECGICGDVAYRPIKLDCGHRFCVKCLIKMQQRAQNACPHCRAPVVLRAGAQNVDGDVEEFLEEFFPIEVRQKVKLDRNWRAKEDLESMGVADQRCFIV